MLRSQFLDLLEPHHQNIATLIFEFSALSPGQAKHLDQFFAVLDAFLAALPRTFHFAVGVRNPEFLVSDYFACLRRHNVAHVYNAWTHSPI